MDPKHRRRFLICLLAFFCACATPPPKRLSVLERVRNDSAVGDALAKQFEKRLRFEEDPKIQAFLREIGRKLSESSEALRAAKLGVSLVVDRGSDELWRNYALPGNKLYLSVSLLKTFAYEIEIAAVEALELAQLQRRDILLELEADAEISTGQGLGLGDSSVATTVSVPENIDFLSPSGLFALPSETLLNAIPEAVELLYQGGFDPRGLVALWQTYKNNLIHSPYEDKVLAKLSERTYRIIAVHAPLLNPVVRSKEFMLIQNRIQKL